MSRFQRSWFLLEETNFWNRKAGKSTNTCFVRGACGSEGMVTSCARSRVLEQTLNAHKMWWLLGGFAQSQANRGLRCEKNYFLESLARISSVINSLTKSSFKKPRFWKRDISSASEKAIPRVFVDIFGSWTLLKKRGLNTQEFACFLSSVIVPSQQRVMQLSDQSNRDKSRTCDIYYYFL